uniref:uncharacterized protein LOC122583260 n=1 Tax=Erigeron canadensis TaxID=72917 RepID=UPI001CB89B8D|nr:uncharacterized protein LOC122583260 [Erigeron canadensis]
MSGKDKHITTLEQLQHEHPLKLVDLLPNYPLYKEYNDDDNDDDDDDDEDDGTKWDFCSVCNLCGQEVNLYQRYYYKCSRNSCHYLLHKWCKELPKTISLRSHSCLGTLTLCNILYKWRCEICKARLEPNESVFRCINRCYFHVDVKCVIASLENRIIYHPSHPHPLACVTYEPNLYHCDACGVKHMGNVYHCTTCFNFFVQSDCLFLSKKKLTTHHTHPLILSYTFSWEHQKTEFYPTCRICRGSFHNETLWIYKCEKCRYYAHLDCVKSKGDQLISGLGESSKNYEESDYQNILSLPFQDQTESIQKYFFSKKTSSFKTNEDKLLNYNSHPLRLIYTQPSNDNTKEASTSSCHNPRERIELLCDACMRPIMSMPFFQCSDQGCPFVFHEWCTRLPSEFHNHPGHPEHTLILIPKVQGKCFGVFNCRVCRLPCNGFAYGCERCEYYIDVTCVFIPKEITHEAHPNHLFFRVQFEDVDHQCLACLQSCHLRPFSYKCRTCEDVYLHPECALFLPKKITHKYDKHEMILSYNPVENHKSEYFCEICEEKFDPKKWFYHCYDECAQSMHSACAPLLNNEKDVYFYFQKGVHEYLNIKFGSVLDDTRVHSHPMVFAQGIDEGGCQCGHSVKYSMVFKCLQCKYETHYRCVFEYPNVVFNIL